ncbi:MAG: copper chaperone PCu(A)C [Mycolicibacterium cosmeticum]|nr:copper chaperone PCu(A)C [Mycolicibacterium cosmeticum]
MAAEVTVSDQWASAAESGMAAVFGTFANAGHHEARIVSGASPVAGRVEVHEVTGDATGTKTMHPKAGGIVVPAAGTHELAPGGDHLMLMDLKAPLSPGAEVPVTVTFEDGSTLDVTAQVRDFAGANEDYSSHG